MRKEEEAWINKFNIQDNSGDRKTSFSYDNNSDNRCKFFFVFKVCARV
jgi:hypothetical protein